MCVIQYTYKKYQFYNIIGKKESTDVKFHWNDAKKRRYLNTTLLKVKETIVLVEC